MHAASSRRARLHSLAATPTIVAALVAAALLLVGLVYAALAEPLSYPAPLDPAAGIALAAVLIYGRPGLIGVAVGSLLLHLALTLHGLPQNPDPLAAFGFALGATAQAWLGARLVERHVKQPLTLSEPRDIGLFFGLGAFVASTIGATMAMLSLGLFGAIELADWSRTWLHWWAAQVLGILLAAPLVLTLLARPRSEWVPRRAVIGVSMLTLIALLTIAAVQVKQFDEARLQTRFEREALNAAASLDFRLQRPLLALEAMRGIFLGSDTVTRSEWQRASESWLSAPTHIQALGWSEYAMRDGVAALESRAHADGLTRYAVRDRLDGDAAAGQPGNEVMPILYIEPLAGNTGALGVNSLSIAEARDAIERAVRSKRAAATAGFRLSQDAAASRQTGVVIYRAVFDRETAGDPPLSGALRGVVFATLRMDDLLGSAFASVPRELTICIFDQLMAGVRQRLVGPDGCEQTRFAIGWDKPLAFADRNWTLRIGATDAAMAEAGVDSGWIVPSIGIVLGTMLGAMLLGMTGHARRVEAAVAERTAALVEQVREREQAEAAMRESEQRFRNIFNNVPIGVVYTDLEGKLQHANPHFCKLTGYASDELLRMGLFDYLHPSDAQTEQQSTERLLLGEITMHRARCRVIRKDGATVWVQAVLTLLRDRNGLPRRLVGVMEDITEHLQLVEAERAREQAESANQAKNEFLSRVSHELRTPLNAMLGFAQLLELDAKHPLVPSQRPWVTQIQQAGWHLLEMINDVLDLSRIESGNVRLQPENLDLEALVDASISLVASDAARRGIVFKRDFDRHPAAVVGDITRVKQILINLLSNAVKYNKDYGKIEISTRHDDAQVTLVITDSGLGMTVEQLAGLFQPFNRLGRERSGLEGTGIGLVISRRLAEWMGGSLHASSVASSSSSFILSLPIATAADTVRSDLDHQSSGHFQYHRRLVHYIEDNETNIEVMRGILAQRPQVRLAVSMTGLDAVAALRSEPPDIVLLDMNLPDISGLELLKHLKADPATASIPVIIVSADALAAQIDAAIAAGASRYITKPVHINEVLRIVDEMLDAAVSRFI